MGTQEQLRLIHQQMTDIQGRLEAVEHRGWRSFVRQLLKFRRPMPEVDASDLSSVLSWHERAAHITATIYYAITSALYLSSFFTGLFVTTSALHLIGLPWRIFIALCYLIVSLGNASCIFLKTKRHQLRFVWPTVMTAAFICVMNIVNAFEHHQPGSIVSSLIFWIIIIGGHIAWGTSTSARVNQLMFTHQLISEWKDQGPPSVDSLAERIDV